jgi:hypothetical protein
MKYLISVIAGVALSACGFKDDADFVKPQAPQFYSERGFQILGYQGYNITTIGRCYWYSLQRGQIVYESCLMKWGDEIHEYSLKAIDAIKP